MNVLLIKNLMSDFLHFGCGLARPASFGRAVRAARPEFQPEGPCLGCQRGTRPGKARHGGHGVPCRPDTSGPCLARARAVPSRAGPMAIYSYDIVGRFLRSQL